MLQHLEHFSVELKTHFNRIFVRFWNPTSGVTLKLLQPLACFISSQNLVDVATFKHEGQLFLMSIRTGTGHSPESELVKSPELACERRIHVKEDLREEFTSTFCSVELFYYVSSLQSENKDIVEKGCQS